MKIAWDVYKKFIRDYYEDKFPHERLGQAFLNTYLPYVTDPSLFYCTDDKKAQSIIEEYYVLY